MEFVNEQIQTEDVTDKIIIQKPFISDPDFNYEKMKSIKQLPNCFNFKLKDREVCKMVKIQKECKPKNKPIQSKKCQKSKPVNTGTQKATTATTTSTSLSQGIRLEENSTNQKKVGYSYYKYLWVPVEALKPTESQILSKQTSISPSSKSKYFRFTECINPFSEKANEVIKHTRMSIPDKKNWVQLIKDDHHTPFRHLLPEGVSLREYRTKQRFQCLEQETKNAKSQKHQQNFLYQTFTLNKSDNIEPKDKQQTEKRRKEDTQTTKKTSQQPSVQQRSSFDENAFSSWAQQQPSRPVSHQTDERENLAIAELLDLSAAEIPIKPQPSRGQCSVIKPPSSSTKPAILPITQVPPFQRVSVIRGPSTSVPSIPYIKPKSPEKPNQNNDKA